MHKEKVITSLKNPLIKNILNLRERKTRDREGLTLIDGRRELLCALESRINIKQLIYCENLIKENIKPILERLSKSTQIIQVNNLIFSKIAYGERQDGVIAVAVSLKYSLNDIVVKDDSLFVVIEAVEKPGNLGAVIRTADAVGVDALIVADGSTDIYNPNVIRSSVGAFFSVKVVESASGELISWLKGRKIRIIAASPHADIKYTDIEFRRPCAIVLGSEHKGLSYIWAKEADFKVKIPMEGKADSLNVSTAASVLLYEALRQKGSAH